MSKLYTITFENSDNPDERLYLCPRGDGESYVLNDSKVGCACWKSYEEAYLFKENGLQGKGRVQSITLSENVQVNKVTKEEMKSIEKDLNVEIKS